MVKDRICLQDSTEVSKKSQQNCVENVALSLTVQNRGNRCLLPNLKTNLFRFYDQGLKF